MENQGSYAWESGIPLTIGIQVPLTKNLEYSTWNSESTTWNPESKTILDSLTWGETLAEGVIFFPCHFCQGLKKKKHYSSRCIELTCRSKQEKKLHLFFTIEFIIQLSIYSMKPGFLNFSKVWLLVFYLSASLYLCPPKQLQKEKKNYFKKIESYSILVITRRLTM